MKETQKILIIFLVLAFVSLGCKYIVIPEDLYTETESSEGWGAQVVGHRPKRFGGRGGVGADPGQQRRQPLLCAGVVSRERLEVVAVEDLALDPQAKSG